MPTPVQSPHPSAQPHGKPLPATSAQGAAQPLRGPVSPMERFASSPEPSAEVPELPAITGESLSLDLKNLSLSLLTALADCPTRDAARSILIQHLRSLMNPTAIHLWRVTAEGQVAAVDAVNVSLPHPETSRLCLPDILQSVRNRGTSITEIDRLRNLVALSLPLGRNLATRNEAGESVPTAEVLTVILLLGEEPLESFLVIVQLLSGYLTLWELETGSKQLREIAQIDQFLLKTIVQMTDAGTATAAARVAVEELRKVMSVGQAAIGIGDLESGACTLVALSGAAEIDARTDLSQSIRAALEATQQRGDIRLWQPQPGTALDDPLALLARQTGASRILSGPLREIDDRVVGSWVIYGDESIENQPVVRNAFVRGERAIARIVTRRGRWGSPALGTSGPPARWKRWRPAIAGLLLVGSMFAPVPYRVGCDAQVQPKLRRFVAAPFAGVLRDVHVEAGDLVQAGDLLARMDDTELRLELSELQAEVDRLTRSCDVHRAEGREVEAVLDGHKRKQAEARLALLESREQHLVISSPISGVILSQDLKRAEGIPVRIGQSLFEVAPLDQMRLELRIPADQIGQIQTGQSVRVGLASQSHGAVSTQVDRLMPNAEIVGSAHVFLAYASLPNEALTLRPGEDGSARIEIGSRALWWTLFHRPWQKLRTQWGW